MKVIQYATSEKQPLPGVLPPVPIRDFKGLNGFDPLSIGENYFTNMQNMTSDDYPAISTRPGYSVIGSGGSRVLGIGVWKDRELHVVFNDGTWRRWNGSSWSTLATGLSTTAEWSFTNFQGNLSDVNLIGCNGVDPVKKYDGSSVTNLSGAPQNGKYMTTYQNRLWCAVGKELWACAQDKPTTWDKFTGNLDDSYRKKIESRRGEDINMLSGSLSKLTIGMPGSLHELYGSLPSDFNTKLITEDTGLANHKAAITQDGFMRFMHSSGIYEYGGGMPPEKSFSEIVGRFIDGITDQSAAGSDGRKLYFNIPSDRMLVFDPRSGIQAWSKWSGIRAVHFSVMQNKLYIGDAQGRMLRLEGTTDNGNDISWSATTKPFNGGSAAQKMRWYKMWMVVELSGTMQIHLSPSIQGEDWSLVQTLTGSGTQVRRVIIPVASFARENWVRVKFSGTGWAKIHEFTRQTRQLPLY